MCEPSETGARVFFVGVIDEQTLTTLSRTEASGVNEETSEMLSFMSNEESITRSLGNGHSVMVMVPEHVELDLDDGSEQLQGRFGHVTEALSKEFPPDQVRRIARSLHGAGFNLNLFPNVAMSMSFCDAGRLRGAAR